jgi:hypothetical protein
VRPSHRFDIRSVGCPPTCRSRAAHARNRQADPPELLPSDRDVDRMHAPPTMPARSGGPDRRSPSASSRVAERSSRTPSPRGGPRRDSPFRSASASGQLAPGEHEQAAGGPVGEGLAAPGPEARRSGRRDSALESRARPCHYGATRRREEGRRPERPRRPARPARDPSPAREIQDPRETGPEGHQTQGTPDPRATRPAGCRTRGRLDPRATRPAGDWTRGMRDAEAGLPVDEAAQREGCRGLHDPSGTGGRGGRDRRTVRGPQPEASRGRRSCPWFSASPLP